MKVRIISAIVAILLAVPFVYFGGYLFAFGMGVLAVLAYKELMDLRKKKNPYPIVPTIIGLVFFLSLIYNNMNGNNILYGTSYVIMITGIIGLLIPALFYKKEVYSMKDAFTLIGILIFLGIGFNSFIIVRNNGILLFLYLVSIPIITDTFALLFGMLIGKHKMAPTISPKKSWEGAIGGLAVGTALPLLLYQFIAPITWKVILLTCLLSALGQIGDLIFSEIKRENGIKDFSNIMPGHGGVLDRLDSSIIIFLSYVVLAIILF